MDTNRCYTYYMPKKHMYAHTRPATINNKLGPGGVLRLAGPKSGKNRVHTYFGPLVKKKKKDWKTPENPGATLCS